MCHLALEPSAIEELPPQNRRVELDLTPSEMAFYDALLASEPAVHKLAMTH